MGDCIHPEVNRRYSLATPGSFFCRACSEIIEGPETDEQRIAREKKLYLRRAHTPK